MKKIYNFVKFSLYIQQKLFSAKGKVLFNDTELRFCVTGLLRYKNVFQSAFNSHSGTIKCKNGLLYMEIIYFII